MDDFKAGQHEAAIADIRADIASIQSDVREIRDIVIEQRGERHAKTVFFGMAGGGVAGLFLKVLAAKLGMHG